MAQSFAKYSHCKEMCDLVAAQGATGACDFDFQGFDAQMKQQEFRLCVPCGTNKAGRPCNSQNPHGCKLGCALHFWPGQNAIANAVRGGKDPSAAAARGN